MYTTAINDKNKKNLKYSSITTRVSLNMEENQIPQAPQAMKNV
jgi:hypothetical protein